jgi:hypothetical protein
MADGVYEVTTVIDGKLIDFDGHFVRLAALAVGTGDRKPHGPRRVAGHSP